MREHPAESPQPTTSRAPVRRGPPPTANGEMTFRDDKNSSGAGTAGFTQVCRRKPILHFNEQPGDNLKEPAKLDEAPAVIKTTIKRMGAAQGTGT